jgi:hypothetical protein
MTFLYDPSFSIQVHPVSCYRNEKSKSKTFVQSKPLLSRAALLQQ